MEDPFCQVYFLKILLKVYKKLHEDMVSFKYSQNLQDIFKQYPNFYCFVDN